MSRAARSIKRVFDSDDDNDSSSESSESSHNSVGSSEASDVPLPPPKLKPAPKKKRARARTSPPPLPPPPVALAPAPALAAAPAVVLPKFTPPSTPHMRLQTAAVHHFYTVISTLAPNLLTETNVIFNETGMYLTAVDDSHSVMVDWRVTKDSMEGLYSCNRGFRIKVDMEEFVDRLKVGKKFESMELALDSADGGSPEKLVMTFRRPDLTRTITIRLMQDDDNEPLEIPNIAYEHFITMPSTTFKDTVGSIQRGSDHVRFAYDVSSPHAETGASDYRFSICGNTQLSQTETLFETVGGAVSNVQFNNAQPAPAIALSSSFLLARVEKFVRVTNATKFVRIYPAIPEGPSNDKIKPMRITYEITNLGPLSFYIAPVFEPDDPAAPPVTAPPRI